MEGTDIADVQIQRGDVEIRMVYRCLLEPEMATNERVHKPTVVQVGRIHASMRVTTRASHTRDTHAEIQVGSCTCIKVYRRVARS